MWLIDGSFSVTTTQLLLESEETTKKTLGLKKLL
jgi:hypothetical protein